ncbi:hypothetical protein [Sphingomonas sp. RIT328]|uniref:hypothetical protein n=1 Tax=Sphingomonas sp. RIT328 TaxID=1470591 RepID=UPI000453AD04|nr:hypothetical protein [Sphingomonas sp. RIT328]EZP49280.1 hypothetical protein BW41_03561 [Sphingomonas sp. RIT328]
MTRFVDGERAESRGDRLTEAALAILVNRRSRYGLLPTELFGEWPWEMLLTLFIADAAGKPLTGGMVAANLACSGPTVARWLQHLTHSGLVLPADATLDDTIVLAPAAVTAIEIYLATTIRTVQLLTE